MRFGALLLPTGTWPDLAKRAQEAEALGFDDVFVDDHAAHPARPQAPWFEAWTALTGLAAATRGVRLGPLVSNVVLRHPVVLARQARTIQELAGGRLEVGLGAGYAPTDHAALGEPPWPPAERAERFEEAVALIAALLQGEPTTFEGKHYRADGMVVAAAPREPAGVAARLGDAAAPRPPLAVAAHGPRALAVAARHADTWVSYGGFNLEPDELLRRTRTRAQELERACDALGRDPQTIRRRLLAGSAALTRDPIWSSPDAFGEFVARLREAGIDELALHYPPAAVNPPGAVRDGAVAEIADRWFARPAA